MLTNSERMVLNGALIRITEGTDVAEAAKTIVEYGSRLPVANSNTFTGKLITTKQGPSVHGYAAGHGETEIPRQEETTEKEWEFGVHKERLGYFRLWHHSSGVIAFHHFWKSSLSTRGDESKPPEYRIRFDPQNLNILYVARLNEVEAWTHCIFPGVYVTRTFRELELLYGETSRLRIGKGLTITIGGD